MTQLPDDEQHRVTKQVIVEHSASSKHSMGAIIAVIVVALVILGFILMQMR